MQEWWPSRAVRLAVFQCNCYQVKRGAIENLGIVIFKEKDPIDAQLQSLEQQLNQPLPDYRRQKLEKELAQVRAGLQEEKEAAYHIDFHLKNNPNWAVIHDLRLEWNGRVAQIDHLLIDRLLEFYVIESKSFRTKVRYANGGWERLNSYSRWEGIPSPVEQNNRHIAVLQELIRDEQLAPTRLGMVITPVFVNVVVVQPSCSIIGNHPDKALIYRMDGLVGKIRETFAPGLGLLKVVAAETVYRLAAALLKYHKPFAARAMVNTESPTKPPSLLHQACQSCGGPLAIAEAEYCRSNKTRFGDQVLCRKCQSYAPKEVINSGRSKSGTQKIDNLEISRCAGCSVPVEAKVVSFCRTYSKRFDGRLLCRSCQASSRK
jgi:hypothetical protein